MIRLPNLFRPLCLLLACAFLGLQSVTRADVHYILPPVPAGFKQVEGKYHILIYDLSDDEAKEVMQRMEAMVDEYLSRTRDFSGRLQGKMPFMIFRKESDYLSAGGMSGTAGVFDPNRKVLMAVAGEKLSTNTWHTIQHEGFHQFAAGVIGGDLPVWANEGLAEYFGEAVYTGDAFVSGSIPEFRRKRIKEEIAASAFRSVTDMMDLSHRQWNEEMKIENYDQAWSMVQFLAHGNNGKYQKVFAAYINEIGRGIQSRMAWGDTFGSAEGFEQRWSEFWNGLPDNPTLDVYARAGAEMLASFAGRAAAQKQTFKTVDELTAAIDGDTLKYNPQDSLPKTLAADCVKLTAALEQAKVVFDLQTLPAPSSAARPAGGAVKCTTPSGTVITAHFRTRGTRGGMSDFKIEVPKAKPPTK